jgi:hypothetical protein
MGLGTWGKTLVLRRVLKEFPMITRAWRWLTDPNAQGRKRGMTAGAAILSATLRGVGSGIAKACVSGSLAGAACTANVGGYAEWVDLFGLAVDKLLIPSADFATVAMGIWAFIDARRKANAAKEAVHPRDW